jgi:nitrous oxide reductase accessory protein NosL
MSFALRFLSLLAALAVTVLLAACGDSSDTSDPAPSSGGSSAASGTSNAQDTARVKLTQCLREQGIDVPDAAETSEIFAQLSPAERDRMQAAMNGPCQKYSSQAFGDTHDPQSQEFLDALTRFTVCLRKNGADVPDPDPNAPFEVLHSLDQSDPTIAAGLAACRDKLQALNGGG